MDLFNILAIIVIIILYNVIPVRTTLVIIAILNVLYGIFFLPFLADSISGIARPTP